MFRKDDYDPVLLEARRARILPEERCPECDGRGAKRVGCASTRSIYWDCLACLCTGLKSKYEEIKKAHEYVRGGLKGKEVK